MSAAILLGFVAALGWGTVDITGAIAARRIGSLRVQVGTLGLATVAVLGFTLLRPDLLGSAPLEGIWQGGLIGAFSAIAYIAYLTALRLGPLAVVSPVVTTYGGITVILAVVVRGESLTLVQAAGAVLATLGVAATALVVEDGDLRRTRLVGPGALMALIGAVVFGSLGVLLAQPIADYGWLPTLVGGRIGNALAGLLLLAFATLSRSHRLNALMEPNGAVDRTLVLLMLLGGLADVTAFGAFSIGVEIGPVWEVGLASSFGPLLVVLYAIWRVGERLRPVQWVGVVTLLAGVILVVTGG